MITRTPSNAGIRDRQRGYVLITSLIFLMVLTMVAVVATKSTTMELKMSKNFTQSVRSFETSETGRMLTGDLVDAHIFNRAWPQWAGGTMDNDTFGLAEIEGVTPLPDGSPRDLYVENGTGTDGNPETLFRPGALVDDIDFTRNIDQDGDGTDDATLAARIQVFKMGTTMNPGSSTAMVAGYEGTGKAAAGSGGVSFFRIRAIVDGEGGSRKITGTDFRHVIRN